MQDLTIYHNPKCSKSRQTLALIRDRGVEPEIVLYLEDVPDFAKIKVLLSKLGLGARDILRTGEADYKTHIAPAPAMDDDAVITLMTQYPKLIERPIVVKDNKAVLGRPPENALELI